MNVQYIKTEDKVFVINENGEIREEEKTNNIKEKLEKENEIENVNNRINKVMEIILDKKGHRKNNIKTTKITMLLPLFVIPIAVLLEYFYGMDPNAVINTIAGPISGLQGMIMLPSFVSIVLCDILFPAWFRIDRPSKKQIKKHTTELKLLKALKKELEEDLEAIKEKSISDKSESQKQFKKLTTSGLKNEINLISYYSNNEDKLKKLHNENRLQEYLKSIDAYDFEIEYIVNLVESDLAKDVSYSDNDVKKEKKGFSKCKKNH